MGTIIAVEFAGLTSSLRVHPGARVRAGGAVTAGVAASRFRKALISSMNADGAAVRDAGPADAVMMAVRTRTTTVRGFLLSIGANALQACLSFPCGPLDGKAGKQERDA